MRTSWAEDLHSCRRACHCWGPLSGKVLLVKKLEAYTWLVQRKCWKGLDHYLAQKPFGLYSHRPQTIIQAALEHENRSDLSNGGRIDALDWWWKKKFKVQNGDNLHYSSFSNINSFSCEHDTFVILFPWHIVGEPLVWKVQGQWQQQNLPHVQSSIWR